MAGAQKPQGCGLTELPPEPNVIARCGARPGICTHRENARSRSDNSAATDIDVELHRHQIEAHTS